MNEEKKKTGLFFDHHGKRSITRIMAFAAFLFACCLALFSVVMGAATGDSSIIRENVSLVIAFLTFAGGVKVAGATSEAIDRKSKKGEL